MSHLDPPSIPYATPPDAAAAPNSPPWQPAHELHIAPETLERYRAFRADYLFRHSGPSDQSEREPSPFSHLELRTNLRRHMSAHLGGNPEGLPEEDEEEDNESPVDVAADWEWLMEDENEVEVAEGPAEGYRLWEAREERREERRR